MSLHMHPHKISPAYVADWSDRRAATAGEIVNRISSVQRLLEGAVAALQMIQEEASGHGLDRAAVELELAAASLDEHCRMLSTDYLEPVKNVLAYEVAELNAD